MIVQKLRQKRLRVSDFALLLVVFEVTYRSEGVNSRENKAVSTVTLCLALPASDITNMVYCMVSNLVSYAQSTVTHGLHLWQEFILHHEPTFFSSLCFSSHCMAGPCTGSASVAYGFIEQSHEAFKRCLRRHLHNANDPASDV